MAKARPLTIDLSDGCLMSRLPEQLGFEIIKGTVPIYGRAIVSGTKIGDRILRLKLDTFYGENTTSGEISQLAVIDVYGDLDKYVVSSIDDELTELWLSSDN